eukprot:403370947
MSVKDILNNINPENKIQIEISLDKGKSYLDRNQEWIVQAIQQNQLIRLINPEHAFINKEVQIILEVQEELKDFDELVCLINDNIHLKLQYYNQENRTLACANYTFKNYGKSTVRLVSKVNPYKFSSNKLSITINEDLKLNSILPSTILINPSPSYNISQITFIITTHSDLYQSLIYECTLTPGQLVIAKIINSNTLKCTIDVTNINQNVNMLKIVIDKGIKQYGLNLRVVQNKYQIEGIWPRVIATSDRNWKNQSIIITLDRDYGEDIYNYRCAIKYDQDKDDTVHYGVITPIEPRNLSCSLNSNFRNNQSYQIGLAINAQQIKWNGMTIKAIDIPFIESISPRNLFLRNYQQTLIIEGQHFLTENLVLQILDYDTNLLLFSRNISSDMLNNYTHITTTIPPDTFLRNQQIIRLTINDTNLHSNDYIVNVLDSMSFRNIYPQHGFQGINNRFFIELENYYPGIEIQCRFKSLKNISKYHEIIVQSIYNESSQELHCELESNYQKRNNIEDDVLSLEASIDNQTWIQLSEDIQIVRMRVDKIQPISIQQNSQTQITIDTLDYLLKQSLQGIDKFYCAFTSPNEIQEILYVRAQITGDYSITCNSPVFNISDFETELFISVNQKNLIRATSLKVYPDLKISQILPSLILLQEENSLQITGEGFLNQDLQIKIKVYDQFERILEEFQTSVFMIIDATRAQFKIRAITNQNADYLYLQFSNNNQDYYPQDYDSIKIKTIQRPNIDGNQYFDILEYQDQTVKISGRGLFKELNLKCEIEGFSIKLETQIFNDSLMTCQIQDKVPQGQYKLNVFSGSLNMRINRDTLDLTVNLLPKILYQNLYKATANHPIYHNITFIMDQDMQRYSTQIIMRLADLNKVLNNVNYDILTICFITENQSKNLTCKIQSLQDYGMKQIYLSFDNGISYFNTQRTLEIIGDPFITEILPKVVQVNQEYQLTIKGNNFSPDSVRAVWFGNLRTSYTFINSQELRLIAPVVTDTEDFIRDIKLETIVDNHYSNSKQIIYSANFNVNDFYPKILTMQNGIQNVSVLGSKLISLYNYTCEIYGSNNNAKVFLTKVDAVYVNQMEMICQINTDLFNFVSLSFYELRVGLSNQNSHKIGHFTIIQRAQLYSTSPNVIYRDSQNYQVNLNGLWTYFDNLPQPYLKASDNLNQSLGLLIGVYDTQTSPNNYISFNVSGYQNLEEIFISLTQDSITYSNQIKMQLFQKPVIKDIRHRFYDVNTIKPYTIQVYGEHFERFQLNCIMSDKVQLRVIYYNTSYIECIWDTFSYQDSYVVGISTNNGYDWVYAYQTPLQFMQLPKLKSISPSTVPSNLKSNVLLEFNGTNILNLPDFLIYIAGQQYQSRKLNESFIQITVEPTTKLIETSQEIILEFQDIDQYYGGLNIYFGRGVMIDYFTQAVIKSQESSQLIIHGSNLDLVHDDIFCIVSNQTYKFTRINSSSGLCEIQIQHIQVGHHLVYFQSKNYNLTQFKGELVILLNKPQIKQFSWNNSELILSGDFIYDYKTNCLISNDNKNVQEVQAALSGCVQINRDIRYCNLSKCVIPKELMHYLSVTISSFNGKIRSNSLYIQSNFIPELSHIISRTFLSEVPQTELLKFRVSNNFLNQTRFYCRFIKSIDNQTFYTNGSIDNFDFGKCQLNFLINLGYNYGVQVSFDNYTWSEVYQDVISRQYVNQVIQVNPGQVLINNVKPLEFNFILREPLLDKGFSHSYKCLFVINDQKYYGNITTTLNDRLVKCQLFVGSFSTIIQSLQIGLSIDQELIPFTNTNNLLKIIQIQDNPVIESMTPKFIINPLQKQTLVLTGKNLETFEQCIITYQGQTWEIDAIYKMSQLKCILPIFNTKLTNDERFVKVQLKQDEQSFYTDAQLQIQMINKLQITDYRISSSFIQVALDKYFNQSGIDIDYYCILGFNNSQILKIKAIQINKNLLNCTTSNKFDNKLQELRIEYYYNSQSHQTDVISVQNQNSYKFTVLNNVNYSKGLIIFKPNNGIDFLTSDTYCEFRNQLTNSKIGQKTQLLTQDLNFNREIFGYQITNSLISQGLQYCIVPEDKTIDDSGLVQVFYDFKIKDYKNGIEYQVNYNTVAVQRQIKLDILQTQRLLIAQNDLNQQLKIMIQSTSEIANHKCSLFQLLNQNIYGSLSKIATNIYQCTLVVPKLDFINLKSQLYLSDNLYKLDYLMLSLDGLIWRPFQEISVKFDIMPTITNVSISTIFESEFSYPFTIEGMNLHPDLNYSLDGFNLNCSFQNQTLKIKIFCLTPNSQTISQVLKLKQNALLKIGYQTNVQEISSYTNYTTTKSIQLLAHQKFEPLAQQINITSDTKILYATFVSKNSIPTDYQNRVMCQIQGSTHQDDNYYINATIQDNYAICQLKFKILRLPQYWNVSLVYRDNTPLSMKPINVYILPMISSFIITPDLLLCNSYQPQILNVTFNSILDRSLTYSNELYIGNNHTKSLLNFINQTFAKASMIVPCKKNLTQYDMNILSNTEDILSPYNFSVLALNRFRVLEVTQSQEYSGLIIKIDREIEFELMIKSLTVKCMIENQISPVYVDIKESQVQLKNGEIQSQMNHVFYCSGFNISDLTNQSLQISILKSDSQNLVISDFSFSKNMKFVDEKSTKLNLLQQIYIIQYDHEIKLKISTDTSTLNRLLNIDLACKVYNQNYTIYLDGNLFNDIVLCYFSQTDLQIFLQDQIFINNNNISLNVSLQLEDYLTLNLEDKTQYIQLRYVRTDPERTGQLQLMTNIIISIRVYLLKFIPRLMVLQLYQVLSTQEQLKSMNLSSKENLRVYIVYKLQESYLKKHSANLIRQIQQLKQVKGLTWQQNPLTVFRQLHNRFKIPRFKCLHTNISVYQLNP